MIMVLSNIQWCNWSNPRRSTWLAVIAWSIITYPEVVCLPVVRSKLSNILGCGYSVKLNLLS